MCWCSQNTDSPASPTNNWSPIEFNWNISGSWPFLSRSTVVRTLPWSCYFHSAPFQAHPWQASKVTSLRTMSGHHHYLMKNTPRHPNPLARHPRPFTFCLNPCAQPHLLLVPFMPYPHPPIILFSFVPTLVIEHWLVSGTALGSGNIKVNNNWPPTLKELTVSASLDITGTVSNTLHKLCHFILTVVQGGTYCYGSPF